MYVCMCVSILCARLKKNCRISVSLVEVMNKSTKHATCNIVQVRDVVIHERDVNEVANRVQKCVCSEMCKEFYVIVK